MSTIPVSQLKPITMLQIIRTTFLNLKKCDKAFPIIFLFGEISRFPISWWRIWSIPVWTLHQAEGTNATALVPALWVKYLSKLTLLRMIPLGHEQLLLWAMCPLLPTAPNWSITNISVLFADGGSLVRASVPVACTEHWGFHVKKRRFILKEAEKKEVHNQKIFCYLIVESQMWKSTPHILAFVPTQ